MINHRGKETKNIAWCSEANTSNIFMCKSGSQHSTRGLITNNRVVPSVFTHTLSLHSHLTKGYIWFPIRTVHLHQTLECTRSCSQIHCRECTGNYLLLCAMQVSVGGTSKLVLLHKSSLMKQIQPVPQETKIKASKAAQTGFQKKQNGSNYYQ